MGERWRKDEKGKWEDHRLNTGIVINTYSMCRTYIFYDGMCAYIYNIKHLVSIYIRISQLILNHRLRFLRQRM